MKQMEQYIPQENIRLEDKALEVSLTMQVELAKMHGEDFYDFTEKHGDDFRKEIKNNPHLLEQFQADPAETLKQIEKNIYH